MNIAKIEKILENSGLEKNEAKIEAKMFVKHFCNLSDIDLILNKNEFDDNENLANALNIRTNKGLPIQYILGKANFMNEDFIVKNSVLIPRDETEILVRKVIEIVNNKNLKQVLDIGTGSGCIACMVAKNTEAQVLGVDISTDALSIALENSSKLELFNKAIFRKSDIYSKIKPDEKFDMIVSNPPYIPPACKQNIQKEVSFEPHSALYTKDEQGIEFYDKIISSAPKYLNPNGYLYFELGINQSNLVKNLLLSNNFDKIEIIKDLSKIDRVIGGQLKC